MRKKLIWLLILASVVLGLRVAADRLLGLALQSAFSAGTGCSVSYSHPKLSLWPLGGSIRNVAIVSPNESPDAGFRADEISIKLKLSGLWSKEILLDDLRLIGASVDSVGTDTGFYNTLQFLFAKDPEPAGGKKWFADWHIHIPKISIYGTPGNQQKPEASSAVSRSGSAAARPRLRLKHGPVDLTWDQVAVVFKEPHSDRNEPYDFSAESSLFQVQLGDTRPIPIGFVGGDGRIGQGVVVFDRAEITPPPGSTSASAAGATSANGKGTIYLGDRDEYDLSVDARIGPETIRQLDGHHGASLGQFHPSLEFSGKMLGALGAPHFFGPLRLKAGGSSDSPHFTTPCVNGEITTQLDLNAKRAVLSEIAFTPEETIGSIEVKFEPGFPYAVSMQTTPEKIDTVRKRCRPDNQALDDRSTIRRGEGAFGLTVQGTVSPLTIKGRIDASAFPLDPIAAFSEMFTGARPHFGPIEMNVSTDFDAHGEFEIEPKALSSAGSINFMLRNLLLAGTSVNSVAAELRFDPDKMEIVRGTISGDLGQAELHGAIPFSAPIAVSGQIKNLAVQALPEVAEKLPLLSTSGSGSFEIAGRVVSPEITSELSVLVSSLERRDRVWQSKLNLKATTQKLSGAASMFEDTAKLQFDLPFDAASSDEMKLVVTANKFPIGELISYYSQNNQSFAGNETQTSTAGEMTGQMTLTAPRSDLLAGSGKVAIQTLRLVQNGVPVTNTRPLSIQLQNGRATIADFEIAAADKTARLSGFVDRRSGWNLVLGGAWALESLVPAISGIEQLSGSAKAALEVKGPVGQPAVTGNFSIQNGSISFPLGSNIYGIEQAAIEGTVDEKAIVFSSINGKFGDGSISGSGRISQPFNSDLRNSEVALRFDDLQLEPVENLSVNIRGDITLQQAGIEPLIVGGNIDIKNAQYQDNIDLLQMIRTVTRYLTGADPGVPRRGFKAAAASSPVLIDLAISADNTILIDTDIVQAELKAALKVRGPVSTPLVDGELTVVDGQFGFKANQFEILVGRITFSSAYGTTDPRLNILGETTLASRSQEENRISLLIQGTLSNPTVNFSSDRGLSTSEIVGLLGIGSNISRNKRNLAGDRTLVELLNPISGISFSDRVAGLTGLRNVRLETAVSPETGEIEPQLHASKPLVDKLVLDIQSNLTGRTSAADIEYRLTPYFSMITGWKSYSATELNSNTGGFNFGVRYRDSFPGLRLFPRSIKQSRGARKEAE